MSRIQRKLDLRNMAQIYRDQWKIFSVRVHYERNRHLSLQTLLRFAAKLLSTFPLCKAKIRSRKAFAYRDDERRLVSFVVHQR